MLALGNDRTLKVMTLSFFICACVISGNANAGFNVVLTAIIYVIYVGILAAVFNKKRSVRGDRGQESGGQRGLVHHHLLKFCGVHEEAFVFFRYFLVILNQDPSKSFETVVWSLLLASSFFVQCGTVSSANNRPESENR